MARRVTQEAVEVLGWGGVVEVQLLFLDVLVELDSPIHMAQIVVEILRTPASTPLFFPVTMIVNG